ncbi:MAG: hypothetical protein B1H13_12230 [Desulfobacteraceae bacterium 4484_190.3]|nr:MAG: hypothetical protein B1H13_12230 [Desulfobacteraceae bacterium 4484_190.3]
MPTIKSKEELDAIQLSGLKWTVNHAYRGSAFYRERFNDTGIKPGDIKSLDDLKRLPFVTRMWMTGPICLPGVTRWRD